MVNVSFRALLALLRVFLCVRETAYLPLFPGYFLLWGARKERELIHCIYYDFSQKVLSVLEVERWGYRLRGEKLIGKVVRYLFQVLWLFGFFYEFMVCLHVKGCIFPIKSLAVRSCDPLGCTLNNTLSVKSKVLVAGTRRGTLRVLEAVDSDLQNSMGLCEPSST